jgi:20S proteasome alpha/beta subunit
MTVCIAAVCNMGSDRPPCVVAACDRMITISGLQYEPQQRKVVQLGSSTIALFAGDMQLHAAVTPRALERIAELVRDRVPQRLTVKETADIYAEEFAYYRRKLAEREVLAPRNMDFEKFARLQTTLPHYQVREIDALVAAHAIDSNAIIAGLDHTGAHIYKVRDPGVSDLFNIPYFACAGSGKDIAETQFMVAQYDKQWPLSKALWLTFSAKARAQVAGGVGPKTDLIIVSPNAVDYATDSQLETLMDMFGRVARKEREYNDEAVAVIEASLAAALKKADHGEPQASEPKPALRPDSASSPLDELREHIGDTGAVDPPTSS